MFWRLLKKLPYLFRTRRSGYSIKGFWGQIKHYNKEHVQIGYSVKAFFGGRRRYNMEGKLVSYTVKNFWGGYNTYDADGNLIRRSYKNLFGGYTTYNRNGKKISESYKAFWGGMNHFDVENPDVDEIIVPVRRRDRSIKESRGGLDNTKRYQISKDNESSNSTQSVGKTSSSRATQGTRSANSSRNTKSTSATKSVDEVQRIHELTVMRDIEQYYNNQSSNIIIDDKVEFYSSVDEYIKERNNKFADIENYMKILVISNGDMKGFPAIVYKKGSVLVVEAIIKNHQGGLGKMIGVEINEDEINNGRCTTVSLDDKKMNNEFATLKVSEIAKEYEQLMPDYEFDFDGYLREQYELPCGLVITSKSYKALRSFVK